MRTHMLALAALVVTINSVSPQALLQKGGEDETGPYLVVDKWMKATFAKPGYIQGSQGGVFAESPNRIFVLNRGELKLPDKLPDAYNGAWGSLGQQATQATPELRNCILVLDANGIVIESWTQWDTLFQGGRGRTMSGSVPTIRNGMSGSLTTIAIRCSSSPTMGKSW